MNNLNGATFSGGVLDLILLGFILLLTLIGLRVGFLNKIVGIVSSMAALIASFCFCKPLSSWLDSTFNLNQKISNKTIKYFSKDPFDKPIFSKDDANAIIKTEKLPSFVRKGVLKKFSEGDTLGTLISDVIAKYCSIVIAFLILLVTIKLLCFIVRIIFARIEAKSPAFAVTNKLLGSAFGAVQAVVYIYLFLFVISLLPGSLTSSLTKVINSAKVCSFLTRHNLFAFFFSGVLNF